MAPNALTTYQDEATQFPLFALPLEHGLPGYVIEELEREVKAGILTKTVTKNEQGLSVFTYCDRRMNQVGYISQGGYWSLRSFSIDSRPIHYQNSQGTWHHINYTTAGEVVSFADALGTWLVVDAQVPFLSRNESTGLWRLGVGRERIGLTTEQVREHLYLRGNIHSFEMYFDALKAERKQKNKLSWQGFIEAVAGYFEGQTR